MSGFGRLQCFRACVCACASVCVCVCVCVRLCENYAITLHHERRLGRAYIPCDLYLSFCRILIVCVYDTRLQCVCMCACARVCLCLCVCAWWIGEQHIPIHTLHIVYFVLLAILVVLRYARDAQL